MTKKKESTMEQVFTPELLADICQQSPEWQLYLDAQAKLSELRGRLASIGVENQQLRIEFTQYSETHESASERFERFLDEGIEPDATSRLQELQQRRASLRDRKTLIEGAVKVQSTRVMTARNLYIGAVLPQLLEMHRPGYRGFIQEALTMLKKQDEIRKITDMADRWELPIFSFKCGVPWIYDPGQANDIQSGLQQFFRGLVESGTMAEEERLGLLHGGTFIP